MVVSLQPQLTGSSSAASMLSLVPSYCTSPERLQNANFLYGLCFMTVVGRQRAGKGTTYRMTILACFAVRNLKPSLTY
jgi:hypothetical protein